MFSRHFAKRLEKMEPEISAIRPVGDMPSDSVAAQGDFNRPSQVVSSANRDAEPIEESFRPSVPETLNAADRVPLASSAANSGGSLLPFSEVERNYDGNEAGMGFSVTDQYISPKSPSPVAEEMVNGQFHDSDVSDIVPISVVLPPGEMSYSSSQLQSEKLFDDGRGEKFQPVFTRRYRKPSSPCPLREDPQPQPVEQFSSVDYSFSAQKIKLPGVGSGLYNLGNTCFMNAILQCFTHTVPLVDSLRSFSHGFYHKCSGDGFCALRALHEHIEVALASSGRSISPWNFEANLSHISSDFQNGEQEDAHEFLQCLLDRLGECCSASLPKEKGLHSQDGNLVEQIFGGRLMSKLRCCNCGYSSDTYERLIDMSLEIENVDTLLSALESFTKVERIEDPEFQFTCEKCKEKVTVEKQLVLDKVPPVVSFHLKRFKTNGFLIEKNLKHVECPLEIDLRPFCVETDDNNKMDLKYELYGIVVHDGYSPNSGHYYSYIRSAPDTWYKLDDWKVTRVQEHDALYEDGYILFYAKQGTPWISSLMEDPKCVDPMNSNTSPKSVLDNIDVACAPYGSPNSDCCETAEPRESSEGPNYQLSCVPRQEDSHFGEIRESVEGFRQEEAPKVDVDLDKATISDRSVPAGAVDESRPGSSFGAEKTCFTFSDGENSSNPKTDGTEENVIRHPLTPLTSTGPDMHSPRTSEKTYQIPRDHLKSEEQGTKRKRVQNIAANDLQREEAKRFTKNMPSSRRAALMAAMMEPSQKKPTNKPGNSRGKPNHSSILRYMAAAGFR